MEAETTEQCCLRRSHGGGEQKEKACSTFPTRHSLPVCESCSVARRKRMKPSHTLPLLWGYRSQRDHSLNNTRGKYFLKKYNHVFTAKGSLPVFKFRVAQVGNIPTHIHRTTPSSTQRQYKAKQQHLPYNTLTTWSQHFERFWNVLAVACNSFSTLRDKGRAIQYESVV